MTTKVMTNSATQRQPVEYLTRKFQINYGLPILSRLTDKTHKFPTLTNEASMALACVALLKLRVAEMGKAQAAGGEWDAELAAAQTFADNALATVSQSQAGAGYFPTPQRVALTLTAYATRKGNAGGKWTAPGNTYDADAFSAINAPAQVVNIPRANAVDLNLLDGVNDNEVDAIVVKTVDGTPFYPGEAITIDGVQFMMTAPYHLTRAAPAAGAATQVTFVTGISNGHDTVNRNVTINIT